MGRQMLIRPTQVSMEKPCMMGHVTQSGKQRDLPGEETPEQDRKHEP